MQKQILLKDAAEQVGVTAGRLRQLCAQHQIGKLLTPRLRVLTPSDVKSLREMVRAFTPRRPRKNSEQTA